MHYIIRKSNGEYLQELFDTVEEAEEKAKELELNDYFIFRMKELKRGRKQKNGTYKWKEVE